MMIDDDDNDDDDFKNHSTGSYEEYLLIGWKGQC